MIRPAIASLALLALAGALSGCIDETLDCAFDDRLELQPPKATIETVVGTPVEYTVTAAVARSPSDDRFIYRFNWDEDSLPPGLTAKKSGRRTWTISGTPRAAGSWGVALEAHSPTLQERRENEILEDQRNDEIFTGNCIDPDAEGLYLFNISAQP